MLVDRVQKGANVVPQVAGNDVRQAVVPMQLQMLSDTIKQMGDVLDRHIELINPILDQRPSCADKVMSENDVKAVEVPLAMEIEVLCCRVRSLIIKITDVNARVEV